MQTQTNIVHYLSFCSLGYLYQSRHIYRQIEYFSIFSQIFRIEQIFILNTGRKFLTESIK